VSEDINVEHLVDVFTSTDASSVDAWNASASFAKHLFWHKPRQTVLRLKISQLPDDHPSKPRCLIDLSWLFSALGDDAGRKELLTHSLMLAKDRGDDLLVAQSMQELSDANRMLRLYEEGVGQAKEALEIYERLGDGLQQGYCSLTLAALLEKYGQLDAAEEVTLRTISILPGTGQEFQACSSHRLLGDIYRSKGEREKGIRYCEKALQIASAFGWFDQPFWIHLNLAELFQDEEKFDDAHAHVEQAKKHAVDIPYSLGRAMETHAKIWHRQGRFEDAVSEASRAIEAFAKAGVEGDLGRCRSLLQEIQSSERMVNDR
jgi:tetratricopeptide (TPR) repeat protein